MMYHRIDFEMPSNTVFIYGLFNDAVSSSDYIATNDRMNNE
jgi:hypothetical protein